MTPNLTQRQLASRASDKMEAKLFYAEKRLQELELMFEGVVQTKLDREQIADSIIAQMREIQTIRFIDELIQAELDLLNKR